MRLDGLAMPILISGFRLMNIVLVLMFRGMTAGIGLLAKLR